MSTESFMIRASAKRCRAATATRWSRHSRTNASSTATIGKSSEPTGSMISSVSASSVGAPR
eukprot:13486111-Heterocapsa_arctica.AAC.1